MLGGSPMSVAVPPRLEAITIGSSNAAGAMPVARAICMAIGKTKITVVTLSQNAERIAVNQITRARSVAGWPPERSTSQCTAHSKTPVVLSTPTAAIIEARRRMTLRSMARWAASNVINRYGVR